MEKSGRPGQAQFHEGSNATVPNSTTAAVKMD